MDEMTWNLSKIAFDNHIDVQWAGVLNEYTPPACDINTKIICMNYRWHRPKEIAFQLAHEISHILKGEDEDICFYTASFTGKSSVEYKANVGAVELMIPYYCDGVDKEIINVNDFEQTYLIPSYLDPVVREQIAEYYIGK